jgi:transposase
VVSRDRAGLYAEAAREGAPQARQVADRFHLLQNFRETIERQLGRYEAPVPEAHVSSDDGQVMLPLPAQSDCGPDAVAQTRLMRRGRLAVRQQLFDEIRALFQGGNSIGEIARKLGLVRNAVLEPWSNGQTEGQINKLKILKRAMYSHAGVELLRARMMPL